MQLFQFKDCEITMKELSANGEVLFNFYVVNKNKSIFCIEIMNFIKTGL